tara:strand:- start:185 stop:436 length:252 start_codon:yes stop_codon:yes gene_type:complete
MKITITSIGLADWISDQEPNYPSLEECKLWIINNMKKIKTQYKFSKEDEDEIKMLLYYIPMNHLMNKNIYSQYLEDTLLIETP